MQQARQAFDRRFLVPQAAGQLRLVTALFLNDRVHTGRNPFELMPMCPGEHCRAILLEASSPRVLGCHNPRLSRVCTRGYSPPNECVLTSGVLGKSPSLRLCGFPPHAGYPCLLRARHSRRAIVMFEFTESSTGENGAPPCVLVPHPIAPSTPAFLVLPARIRGKEDASRRKATAQLVEHARQLLARDMKERSVSEHAVKALWWQGQPQKILVPDLAAAVGAGHLHEPRCPIYANGLMSQLGKGL